MPIVWCCPADPAKRREYDSTDDVDDSLPQECPAADFYKASRRGWFVCVSGVFAWVGWVGWGALATPGVVVGMGAGRGTVQRRLQ